ncbi:hypothetical protein [Speluncibacter jeojiensis]|uniref:Uncharacterized protein n=1 Tax=Speluncibacter jeojiensis TaxID=2710754 RepID=A0A9X4RE84_9ACTN|nr:hypothetical protein [Corynebacteriales bacterium D3-21]
MRWRYAAVAGLAGLSLVAGCASDGGSTAASATSSAAPSTANATAAHAATPIVTTPVPPPPDPFAGPAQDVSAAVVAGRYSFTSPDGTFRCAIVSASGAHAGSATCQGITASVPPRPATCAAAQPWGDGMQVDDSGRVGYLCGTLPPAESAPIVADSVIHALGFTCVAHAGSTYCRDDVSEHGFRIAQDSHAVF